MYDKVSSEAFMVMIQVEVFGVVMSCSVVLSYHNTTQCHKLDLKNHCYKRLNTLKKYNSYHTGYSASKVTITVINSEKLLKVSVP